MTKLNVYALYDATTETFIAQFQNTHDKLMARECENLYEQAKLCHDKNPISPQGSLYRYSDQYTMYKVGTFDDQTGIYENIDVKVPVCFFGDIQQRQLNSDIDNHAKNLKLVNNN